jgi:hypothetical protein
MLSVALAVWSKHRNDNHRFCDILSLEDQAVERESLVFCNMLRMTRQNQ